jgi:CBS domain-containing protein
MQRLTAEQIMIPLDSYPHVPFWFTLRQAIASMERSQLESGGKKSLPRVVLVFDEEYQLMGMVRRRDILRGLSKNALQDRSDSRPTPAVVSTGDMTPAMLEKLQERAERTVGEVMTPVRSTIDHSTSIIDLIEYMVVHDTAIVPVIRDGAIVGIARSADVLHHVGKMLM